MNTVEKQTSISLVTNIVNTGVELCARFLVLSVRLVRKTNHGFCCQHKKHLLGSAAGEQCVFLPLKVKCLPLQIRILDDKFPNFDQKVVFLQANFCLDAFLLQNFSRLRR
mgnify:CR=1 FL=1